MINKSFETAALKNSISDNDLRLINKYSQKELSADEIFTFSVILCDNEVDRDFERFSVNSLNTLAKLYIGKTAIRDHSMKSGDQSGRTYKTEVVCDTKRKNSLGEDYVYLKAWCYMPIIEKNKDIIAEINAGILKEVSVGCSVESSVCSICGQDIRKNPCIHKRGKSYNEKLCFYELQNPTDAYEWSFVAVPAQKNAGVTKKFSGGDNLQIETEKQLRLLQDENQQLKQFAELGKKYRLEKEEKLADILCKRFSSLDKALAQKLFSGLSFEELTEILKSISDGSSVINEPQLLRRENEIKHKSNSQFKF